MVAVTKIDSNATGLSYAEEQSLGVLPGTPDWIILEPNTYDDFGGQPVNVARNPINASRQRKKGVITDLNASGGFNTDLTQTNLEDILQGFMFADLRPKGEEVPTAATGTTDLFDVASTSGFLVGGLVKATGFVDAGNNVVEEPITAVVSDTTVEVLGATLVTDAAPGTGVKLVVVGHEAISADIDVVVSGPLPHYLSNGGLDFTTLGLLPGEWIFVGGDSASEQFVNGENNGWKRVKSITATQLTVDKSDVAMTAETGTALLIRFYFGRVLKNEASQALIKRRSYQLERTLGVPDDAEPTEIQSEYIVGAVPNVAQFNIPSADKLTMDLSFVAQDQEVRTGVVGVKTGNRPVLVESDAFNTSSDFSRIKLSVYDAVTEAPTPLFAFAQEISISIGNNLTPNKAVGFLGSFEITAGTFEVSGNITAYFADVAGITAVKNNEDITLDAILVKGAAGAKTGIAIDLPLITLGDGRPNVEQDQAITLPLVTEAATGAGIDVNMNHTIMMVFFDFLPDAADL